MEGLAVAEQRFTAKGAKQYILRYLYDESNSPIGFGIYYPTASSTYWQYYYFGKNIQGDVIALYRSDYNSSNQSYYPTLVATYSYDPWGAPTGIYDANGNTISQTSNAVAAYNPFRYRGYRYDGDTRLYYLQSRYYDPAVKRFINADTYASTGQGFIGYNMFAYCMNNPVCHADENGELSWQQVFYVGITTSLIGFAILATLPTGGGSLLLAGASGGAMTASAATSAAAVSAKIAVIGGTATAAASVMYSSISKPPTSRNQMQKQAENGQAPKEVDRVDGVHTNLKPPNNQPHIHFKNGTAINLDGTMHHGGVKDLKITNQIAKWLLNNGWSLPTIK